VVINRGERPDLDLSTTAPNSNGLASGPNKSERDRLYTFSSGYSGFSPDFGTRLWTDRTIYGHVAFDCDQTCIWALLIILLNVRERVGETLRPNEHTHVILIRYTVLKHYI